MRTFHIAAIGLRGLPSAYSGLERAGEGLYAELARRGHEVTVYCRPEYVGADGCEHRRIRLRRAPAIRTRALDTLSHVAASVIDAIRRGGYDLIHLHVRRGGRGRSLRKRGRRKARRAKTGEGQERKPGTRGLRVRESASNTIHSHTNDPPFYRCWTARKC